MKNCSTRHLRVSGNKIPDAATTRTNVITFALSARCFLVGVVVKKVNTQVCVVTQHKVWLGRMRTDVWQIAQQSRLYAATATVPHVTAADTAVMYVEGV